MDIEKEIMDKGKAARMQQLKQRYFDLYMDKVSLEANGYSDEAVKRAEQMEIVKKSYLVIANINTTAKWSDHKLKEL